jgi:hypothetical protein
MKRRVETNSSFLTSDFGFSMKFGGKPKSAMHYLSSISKDKEDNQG